MGMRSEYKSFPSKMPALLLVKKGNYFPNGNNIQTFWVAGEAYGRDSPASRFKTNHNPGI